MDKISAEDLLKIQVFALRARVLELEREAHVADMIKRYEMREGDQIDVDGALVRVG